MVRGALIGIVLSGCARPPATLEDTRAETGDSTATGCPALTANIRASRLGGSLPLTIDFDAERSCGPEAIASHAWLLDGVSLEGEAIEHTWLASGVSEVILTVTDDSGAVASTSLIIEATAAQCPEVVGTVQLGESEHKELDEASSLMASRADTDLVWSHNDSGDTARLFALGMDGRHRGIVTLDGAEAEDWEDSALYVDPETGATTLFIGDIGDNNGSREAVSIVMVPEPGDGDVTGDWTTMTLAYPDARALDAHTLLADPQTGDLYLVATSPEGPPALFRKPAPHVPDSHTIAEEVVSLDVDGAITGGAFSPLGDRILLRTGDAGHLWLRDARFDLVDALQSPACLLPVADEVRGEAIEFTADGTGYLTLSEEAHQPLWRTDFVAEVPCDGLQARIVTSPMRVVEVPAELTFQADPFCIPEGLAEAQWVIDGELIDEASPTRLFLDAGDIEVYLTVTDTAGDTSEAAEVITLAPQSCPEPGEAEAWGSLQSDEIDETSGIVVSPQGEGVIWVHNDSGDTARLFALSLSGELLGTHTLLTAPRDWEDLTRGWNEELGQDALYIGDIGDNGRNRDAIAVLILPEPDASAGDQGITDFSTMTLRYPDELAHNSETLAYDPRTGSLIIVTKATEGTSHVFEKPAPHEDGTDTTLTWVATLQFGVEPLNGSGSTTGGAFSPLGDQLIVRTYSGAWIWRRGASESLAEALAGEACDADAPREPQGEAIGYTPDGEGYVTISEGEGSLIWFTPLP
ncbi:MAG: PKD repeat protein [Myxococcota bacterium]|jgi:PKD repeat protein